MNTPVNFELAKLLKEKGFDYHLLYNDFANEYDYFDRSVQGRIHVSDFPEDKFPDSDKWIPVPYISQVVMWLYEKHGIWISVDCDCYGILWYANLSVASEKNWDNIDLRHEIISASKKFPNEHNSPTEAYEAALLYTLNNLI